MMPLRVVVLLFANANHARLSFYQLHTRGALFNQIVDCPTLADQYGEKEGQAHCCPYFPPTFPISPIFPPAVQSFTTVKPDTESMESECSTSVRVPNERVRILAGTGSPDYFNS